MKVAIDTSPLTSGHKVRGIGAHTRELVKALEKVKQKQFILNFVDFNKVDLSDYDVVHYQHFHPFFPTLPERKPTKVIVTIHDLIQLIYPHRYPSGARGRLQFIKQKRLLKNVDKIITISETSKKDIVRFLKVESNDIEVIHLAARDIFKKLPKKSTVLKKVRDKFKLPDKFVLYVGDINYNKNIPGLIKAAKLSKLPLVIVGKQALAIETEGMDITKNEGVRDWLRFFVGKPHPELAHYKELLIEFRNNTDVIRLGYVTEEELVALYNLATVYCQPSLYEGFGLPILEAMACGCPVVVTRINALVEVADNAALISQSIKPDDIAQKLAEISMSSRIRNDYIEKGLKRSSTFSWKKTAEETLDVYKLLAES